MPRIYGDNDIINRMRAIEKAHKVNEVSVLESEAEQVAARPKRALTSQGGSDNEILETQIILSERRLAKEQEDILRYGGNGLKQWQPTDHPKEELTGDEKLKEQFKEDREHSARYVAETMRQLEEQNSKGVNA